jgi:M50 family peptidase
MFFGYSDILTFLIALVAIVLSIMLHEVAHGLVALWNGDDTAKRAGRLNLNPVSHFDPVGFLMLIFLRFGYAKPVPVNPYNFKNRKVGMFTVSVAGVTLNLILAFFCYPLFVVCSEINYLSTFLLYMVVVNLNLAAFNLLPLYPLDGYRILNCFIPETNKFMSFLKNYSRYILIFLLALGIIRDVLDLPLWFDPLSWLLNKIMEFFIDAFDAFWGLFIR